ncbi:RpiB/LacA/LacB family sugar-phosphate isomerase [Porifericola rhodea]|uniref:RpiB/LacA/LacB family sugar-phosphate isomerase n=1 Tax=Porifericola rhodea TaxID=930972 RepID=UPI0026655249|nr:RpiB/LacA/LacB family sugar-phosphate isomerase [Porifericola rhodea]WKN31236.1 RpiB/LacA/LacB family sugar-phosphate isomerase [Porifericola rhodea]
MMKIGIAADHGGFELKELIKKSLQDHFEITDFGADSYDAQDDYPDFVQPLAEAVAQNKVERGIAICGSGIGACIVANKIQGVRAALINETYSAHQGVEHDDMNIICIGARVVGDVYAMELIHAFLNAGYTGEERHARRLTKLKNIEDRNTK